MAEVDFHSIAKELFIKPKLPLVRASRLPGCLSLELGLSNQLRYGENDHQDAGMYYQSEYNGQPLGSGVLERLDQLWGQGWPKNRAAHKGLSLTNVGDVDAGIEAIRWFKDPAAVVIKHHSPCGIALGETIGQAAQRAIESDPESAFGGVFVLNRRVTPEVAEEVAKFKKDDNSNIDVVTAPSYDPDALKILRAVPTKNMRVYRFGHIPRRRETPYRLVAYHNGFAVQEWNDDFISPAANWEVMTEAKPTEKEARQALVGWAFINAVRSNAILVLDRTLPMSRGIGAGQTSRLRSTEIALRQAGDHTRNGLAISDGFIPFIDNLEAMEGTGIRVVVQPGGSVFDKKAIAFANRTGMVMVKTGQRAFRH